jgi:hypothetical protein
MSDDESDLRAALQSAYDFGPDFPHRLLLSRISAELARRPERKRRGYLVAGVATSVVTALIVVAFIAIPRLWQVPAPIAVTSPPAPQPGVVAILANNHLAYVPSGATKAAWDLEIAPAPDLNASHGYSSLGHRVAVSPDGSLIYALPAQGFIGATQLVIAESATGHVVQRIELPNSARSARYGALTVAASGDIWIVGSVGPVPGNRDLPFRQIDIVRVRAADHSLSSWLGRVMSNWVPQGPVGGDFDVYEVQVGTDEQRIYYSYTGGLLEKAGLDWVDLRGQQTTTCTPPTPDNACVPGLAGFFVQGNDVYMTTAFDQPSGAIDHVTLNGAMRKHIALGLLPGFLEDFAVAPDGTHIVIFGSCGYSGGMAVIDLATQTSKVIVQAEPAHSPPTSLPCGQSSVFLSDNLIALGHVGALHPSDAAGQILYVDSASGKVEQSVAISAEPIALVALP